MCARSGKWCGIVLILLLGISGPYASEAQHPGIGIGACGGIMNFMSDISPEKMGFLGEASLDLPFSRNFSAILTGGFGKQNFSQDNQSLATQLTTIDLKGAYRLSLSPSVHPMLYLGFGVINFKHADLGRYWDGMGIAGAGLDLSLGKSLGFQILADYRYTSGDDFDGVAEGGNDPYFSAKAGINYRLPSKNKFKEESLATTVVDADQTDEEIELLSNILGNQENSSSEMSTETDIPKDDDLLVRIQKLNKMLAEREESIKEIRAALIVTDQKIATLELELKGEKVASSYSYDSSADFSEQYQIGMQKYNERVYNEAINIFQTLITTDPDNKLASNCQYWIGECKYASNDFGEAIEAFERIFEYPNSNKADDAMLMIGLSYKRMQQEELARQYFEKLVTEFPDSEYASIARRHLETN